MVSTAQQAALAMSIDIGYERWWRQGGVSFLLAKFLPDLPVSSSGVGCHQSVSICFFGRREQRWGKVGSRVSLSLTPPTIGGLKD